VVFATGLMWSIAVIIFKPISLNYPFVTVAAYENFGAAVGGLVIYFTIPLIREKFHESLRANKQAIIIVLVNEGLYIVSKYVHYLAFSLGPVALVSVIGSTQVFFGIVIGIGLTKLFPKIFEEDLTKKTLISKFSWSAIMLLGLWFLG